jgi:hypothetical protein
LTSSCLLSLRIIGRKKSLASTKLNQSRQYTNQRYPGQACDVW